MLFLTRKTYFLFKFKFVAESNCLRNGTRLNLILRYDLNHYGFSLQTAFIQIVRKT